MPYSAAHKEKSRNKLLASAFELFARQGYDKVTIDAVAKHAGLTRGAFYNHFKSKQRLYSEAMTYAAQNSKVVEQMKRQRNDSAALITLIENYLSHHHLDSNQPCPLAFLVTDVANQEPEVRASYTRIFEEVTRKITALMQNHHSPQGAIPEAQALAALLIGGVAIGRALDNDSLTDQVMNACRSMAVNHFEQTSK